MQICDRLKTSQTLDQNSKFYDTIMIHDTIVVKHFVSQIMLLHAQNEWLRTVLFFNYDFAWFINNDIALLFQSKHFTTRKFSSVSLQDLLHQVLRHFDVVRTSGDLEDDVLISGSNFWNRDFGFRVSANLGDRFAAFTDQLRHHRGRNSDLTDVAFNWKQNFQKNN